MIRKLLLAMAVLALFAAPALAQEWGVGASVGLVNDVEHRIRLDGFDPRDATAWVDFQLEDRVLLRGTMGSMKVRGSKAGESADVGGNPIILPDLNERIHYVNVGASYQFWEGDYTSGIFAGIGGYRIDPDSVDRDLEEFRDPKETVFGFHVGLDGDLRVFSRLSIVGRITFHKIFSDTNRSLLTANAGAAFRF